MERKLFAITAVCLLTLFGIITGASAVTIDIGGPWLWMITPAHPINGGGAASTNFDSLDFASTGRVTEQMIAQNGAAHGAQIGNHRWTPGIIGVNPPPLLDWFGLGNINECLNAIGLTSGDVDDATSYALIHIASHMNQGATMLVGSDDAVKVWLNGQVVHINAINRSSRGYQAAFQVNLSAGDNLLMVKVSERKGKWRMFVGLDVLNPNTIAFHMGNVNFPDTHLADEVRQALSLPNGANIPKAQLATLTDLRIPMKGITDLTGLEFATQLEVLDLSDNDIVDLSPLAGLTQLEHLDLSKNRIVDLSPLAGLTKLRQLKLFKNYIISDLSPLVGLTQLEHLDLSDNDIVDLSPLAGLTQLEHLDLSDNKVIDLRPLAGLTQLEELSLLKNPPPIPKTLLRDLLAQNPKLVIDISVPKLGIQIKGPWLWMIAPTHDTDSLAAASNGQVTEQTLSTHGANKGDTIGKYQWTLGTLNDNDDANTIANNIGFKLGDIDDYSAYALIGIKSDREQSTEMRVYGNNESSKVWLNGDRIDSRSGPGFLKTSGTLKDGKNLLMIQVSNSNQLWDMIVSLDDVDPKSISFYIPHRQAAPNVPGVAAPSVIPIYYYPSDQAIRRGDPSLPDRDGIVGMLEEAKIFFAEQMEVHRFGKKPFGTSPMQTIDQWCAIYSQIFPTRS